MQQEGEGPRGSSLQGKTGKDELEYMENILVRQRADMLKYLQKVINSYMGNQGSEKMRQLLTLEKKWVGRKKT